MQRLLEFLHVGCLKSHLVRSEVIAVLAGIDGFPPAPAAAAAWGEGGEEASDRSQLVVGSSRQAVIFLRGSSSFSPDAYIRCRCLPSPRQGRRIPQWTPPRSFLVRRAALGLPTNLVGSERAGGPASTPRSARKFTDSICMPKDYCIPARGRSERVARPASTTHAIKKAVKRD